jgi:hypothetical protein
MRGKRYVTIFYAAPKSIKIDTAAKVHIIVETNKGGSGINRKEVINILGKGDARG